MKLKKSIIKIVETLSGRDLFFALTDLYRNEKITRKEYMAGNAYWLKKRGYNFYEGFGWHKETPKEIGIGKVKGKWYTVNPAQFTQFLNREKNKEFAQAKQAENIDLVQDVKQVFNI